ncbi:hypothetical protein DCE79_14165 [Lysinibacillus sp. 2017]|nr:hypothetical protein DCE79_14165 [Lysinibacillus sp. 2017]TGN34977.1 stage V sporulation protein M [Lysinibacillus sp. S2017]
MKTTYKLRRFVGGFVRLFFNYLLTILWFCWSCCCF